MTKANEVGCSDRLNSPYGFMTVNGVRHYDGHPVVDRELVGVSDPHRVPRHWLTTGAGKPEGGEG